MWPVGLETTLTPIPPSPSPPPPPVIVSRSHIARVELGEVGAQGELSGEKAREEVCRRLGKSEGMTCGKNASSFEEVF